MSDEEHDGPSPGPWEAKATGRSNDHHASDDSPDCSRPSGEPAGPRILRPDPDDLLSREVERTQRADAAELRQRAAFTRQLRPGERAELARVSGRPVPRSARHRFTVAVLRAEGGQTMRLFALDGRTVAAVTDPPVDGVGWAS